jgi:hypothetical protein
VIPISASCIHRRTVHIHKDLFDARGEPAVQVQPLDFRLVAMRLSSRPMPGASLLVRSSKPRDFGVARMSSIPLSAASLLFRSSKPLGFRLVARGCHQYHCRRRQSADLVSCTQIVVSTLVVVVAMENSARSCCEISAYNSIKALNQHMPD